MHAVEIQRSGRTCIVCATGELDAFAAPDLDAALAEVRDEPVVVADLDRVSFMDSTALGVLVRRVRELVEGGCDVRVVLPRGTARRIFEITALDRALPVAADRQSALAELGARPG
jgi:anti-sigma B factor antagonist